MKLRKKTYLSRTSFKIIETIDDRRSKSGAVVKLLFLRLKQVFNIFVFKKNYISNIKKFLDEGPIHYNKQETQLSCYI